MGNISVTSTGKSTARMNYTTTYSGGQKVMPLPYEYAVMYIDQARQAFKATGGTSQAQWQQSQPVTLTWDVELNIRAFANCASCDFDSLPYRIYFEYGGLKFVESGTITVSGPVPCSDCPDNGGNEDDGGEDDGGGGGGGEEDNPYGPTTPGDIPNEPPTPTSDPCVPPQPTPPNPPVPTPCGGGNGSGPGSFS